MKKNYTYDTLIVGAGLAGLSAALRLNKKGKNVLVVEKNDTVGGKLTDFSESGFRWDNGPSLLTEPELLYELFKLYDRNPEDYIQIEKHDESCKYYFGNNSSVVLNSSMKVSKENIASTFSSQEADIFERYVNQSKKDYQSIGNLFLNDKKPSLFGFLRPKFIKHYPFLMSKKMFRSLDKHNKSQFETKELNLIFNRFGTYNGSNPYTMSGLYSMIPSLELTDGTYFPKDGMRSIIDALYRLAKEENITFSLNTTTEIEKIESGYSYRNSDNKTGKCENVVCAIDHISFYDQVFKDQALSNKYKKKERSTSGLVYYWGIDLKIDELGLHNILFSDDYKNEFDSIFERESNPKNPTIYIHVSSVINEEDAPINGQNLFVMVNTSANDTPDQSYRDRIKEYIIKRIHQEFKVDLSNNIIVEKYWDNASIESITGSYKGALYGASSNKLNSANTRHPNESKKYANLYFCGGTVHPGGGIPLVLRSAKIVENSIR